LSFRGIFLEKMTGYTVRFFIVILVRCFDLVLSTKIESVVVAVERGTTL
jgi:hypothetical protein